LEARNATQLFDNTFRRTQPDYDRVLYDDDDDDDDDDGSDWMTRFMMLLTTRNIVMESGIDGRPWGIQLCCCCVPQHNFVWVVYASM
jgi:hypothetical protein